MTILDQLADFARIRTRQAQQILPMEKIRQQALQLPKGDFSFEAALKSRTFPLSASAKGPPPQRA